MLAAPSSQDPSILAVGSYRARLIHKNMWMCIYVWRKKTDKRRDSKALRTSVLPEMTSVINRKVDEHYNAMSA